MSADIGAGDAASGRFDSLYAEAKSVLGYAANQLRALTEAYRQAYGEDLTAWHRHRDDLDADDRRALGGEIAPRGSGDGEQAAAVADGGPGLPEGGGNRLRGDETLGAVDDSSVAAAAESAAAQARLGELRRQVAMDTSRLGERTTELAHLELAVRTMERAWLFLERGDETLLADPVAPDLEGDFQMRIVEAREAERSLLAQEVHDGPAQALANAIFQVEYIDKVLDHDPRAVRTELHLMRERLRRELGDVRAFISQLRPPLLDQLGLNGSIDDTAKTMAALSGVEIEADLVAPEAVVSDAEQVVVLRILQEALQNVRKHAAARHVWINTRLEEETWMLEVRDDGRGFDPDTIAALGRRNFGMQFMRERAELVGARFEARSRPSGGTVVRLAIPVGEERRLRR